MKKKIFTPTIELYTLESADILSTSGDGSTGWHISSDGTNDPNDFAAPTRYGFTDIDEGEE